VPRNVVQHNAALLILAALVVLLVRPSPAGADVLCWIHPHAGDRPESWELAVAGIPIAISPQNHGPSFAPDGTAGIRWCAAVSAHGLYSWTLVAVKGRTRQPGVNSPLARWGAPACRQDLNGNGAVDLGDISSLLGSIGQACTPP